MTSNHADLPLPKTRYGVGVSWDVASRGNVDVDLQAVIVDNKGSVIDAVYYNNLKALKAITHSGDEQTGEKAGMDELIWITLSKMPEHVRLIIFVVAAYSGGSLRDASNGMLHILEERKESEVARFQLEQSQHNVDAVAMVYRSNDGSWFLRIIEEPAEEGRHFIDILEPTLGNIIRNMIPGAPKKQKVAFAMEKGSVVDLPPTNRLDMISAGLGWDVNPKAGDDVDLDVSAVLFSKEFQVLGAVFFGNIEEFGLLHSGDNLTGEGAGDDEVIQVDFNHVPANVEQIFFVVNVYTKNVTFEMISNAYCRIFNAAGEELARYVLRDGRGERGLILARLFREPGGRWGFQACGKFCRGQTWKDSVPDIESISRLTAVQLQMRGSSSASLGGDGFSHAAPSAPPLTRTAVAAVPPSQKDKSSACSLM
eukprot:TRINITY_DN18473_c0_g3_i1.p1 TRINITY_DN18473_c0_g3~~TRINITY_DN18473_c0_g3_i1.p1  ORF type:complete len:446 (+),score=95.80 TRINITY_DN18473_c0_g3_i1:68-1339(+)